MVPLKASGSRHFFDARDLPNARHLALTVRTIDLPAFPPETSGRNSSTLSGWRAYE